MPTKNHNLLLNRAFQYLGIILIMAALGGGYWYWKQAQAGANIKAPSNSGLKAYWKFDETAGTSATDSSGNNNTGTLQSSPSRVEGKKNKAITFNGSNQYVSVPDSTSINIGTAVTVSAWVKGDSWADGDTNAVYIKYLSHYVTVNTSGNVGVYGYGKSPVGYHHSNQALKTGIWYNIAVTIDASEFRIYIDGKLDKTVSATGTLSTSAGQAAAIGAEPGGGSRYFNGSIDEVRIYNRALPMEEIASSYAETKIDYSFENSLEQGLVGYWKLDDASGTSAADASGNANTGTLTNGPTWTTGQIGGATDFDGTDDYITVPDGNSLDLTSDMTISVWANADNWTGEGNISTLVKKDLNYILRKDADAGTGGSGLKLLWWNGTNLLAQRVSTLPTTGAWHHIVGVIESNSTRKIYVDGVLQSGTDYSSVQARVLTANLSIGNHQSAGTESFDGKLDEVRIYNRALSADEVTKLYKTTTPDDPDTGLVGYWSFNGPDISGTTAYDRSGKGGNGTLTNGPTKTIGKIGQAFSFNGTNQYASLGINKFGPILNGRSQVTVSAWVNPSAYPADAARKRILSILINDTSAGVLLNIYDDSGLIEMGGRSSTGDLFQTASVAYPALNEWHFVTGILDFPNDKIYLYLDGVLRVTQSVTFANASYTNGTPTTLTDSIGSLSTTGEYFSGKIDEPRIYNRALSASEIWNLYQAGAADKVNSADSQIDSLEKGMVGYWKLDDASGTSAADASGNTNTGTLTNGPTWTTGQIGGATSFDGTDDYIATNDINALDGIPAMTVSAWVNVGALSQDKSVFTKSNTSADSHRFGLSLGGTGYGGTNDITINVSDGSNQYAYTDNDIVSTGVWSQYVMVFDGTQTGNSSRLKLYQNGILRVLTFGGGVTIPATTSASNAGVFQIGAETNHVTSNRYWNGSIDEVRVYNRALSADEVAKLYKTTTPDNPDTGLVGYWPFNGPDISGTTAYDRSGKANNGTLTNGPTRAIGKIGQGMSFDGSDDYVALGTTSTAFNFANNLSASAWIKTATNGKLILDYQNSTPLVYMSVGPTTAGGTANKFVVYLRTNSGSVAVFSSAQSVTDNAWHHVAFTRDTAAQKVRFYIDGSFDSEISYTDTGAIDTSGASSHRIGGTGSYYFNGSIDEVRVFNRALTQTEITALYNAGR